MDTMIPSTPSPRNKGSVHNASNSPIRAMAADILLRARSIPASPDYIRPPDLEMTEVPATPATLKINTNIQLLQDSPIINLGSQKPKFKGIFAEKLAIKSSRNKELIQAQSEQSERLIAQANKVERRRDVIAQLERDVTEEGSKIRKQSREEKPEQQKSSNRRENFRNIDISGRRVLFAHQERTDEAFKQNLSLQPTGEWQSAPGELSVLKTTPYSSFIRMEKLIARPMLFRATAFLEDLQKYAEKKLMPVNHQDFWLNGQHIIFEHQSSKPLFPLDEISQCLELDDEDDGREQKYLIQTLHGRKPITFKHQHKTYVVPDEDWARLSQFSSYRLPNVDELSKPVQPEKDMDVLMIHEPDFIETVRPEPRKLISTPSKKKLRQIFQNDVLSELVDVVLALSDNDEGKRILAQFQPREHPAKHFGLRSKNRIAPPPAKKKFHRVARTPNVPSRSITLFEVHFDLSHCNHLSLSPENKIVAEIYDKNLGSEHSVLSSASNLVTATTGARDETPSAVLFNDTLTVPCSKCVVIELRVEDTDSLLGTATIDLGVADFGICHLVSEVRKFDKIIVGQVQLHISEPIFKNPVVVSPSIDSDKTIVDSDSDDAVDSSVDGLLELEVRACHFENNYIARRIADSPPGSCYLIQFLIGPHVFQTAPIPIEKNGLLQQEFHLWLSEQLNPHAVAHRLAVHASVFLVAADERDILGDPEWHRSHLLGSWELAKPTAKTFWLESTDSYSTYIKPLKSIAGSQVGHISFRMIVRNRIEVETRLQHERKFRSNNLPKCNCPLEYPDRTLIRNLESSISRVTQQLSLAKRAVRMQKSLFSKQQEKFSSTMSSFFVSSHQQKTPSLSPSVFATAVRT